MIVWSRRRRRLRCAMASAESCMDGQAVTNLLRSHRPQFGFQFAERRFTTHRNHVSIAPDGTGAQP